MSLESKVPEGPNDAIKENDDSKHESKSDPRENSVIRLKIHAKPHVHRKRKRDGREQHINPLAFSESSSSSSSDEDDDETKLISTTAVMAAQELVASQVVDQKGPEHVHTSDLSSSGQDRSAEGSTNGTDKPGENAQAASHDGWRVKLYRLNGDGSWDDCGTGRIMCLYKTANKAQHHAVENETESWIYRELGEPTLCMHAENASPTSAHNPRILLRTRILLREPYQRQGDNIITWCEPFLEEGEKSDGVDLALSFQDNEGCLDVWRQITQVQGKAAALFERPTNHSATSLSSIEGSGQSNSEPSLDARHVAQSVANAHHQALSHQQHIWVNVPSGADSARPHHMNHADEFVPGNTAHLDDHAAQSNFAQLPNPPSLANLEEIADTIAAVQHIQHRELLAVFISQNDCSYLKSLLSLFPSAESHGDFGSLATLAACVKSILLLNDPSIIELIVSDELLFEELCSTLEYDPDLRDKANHRWFLRERAKFRTVVLMEDEDLVSSIHRAFRVTYLRDTLLRPTMDESSLSTLSSLQTFTHSDVVKGVIGGLRSDQESGSEEDTYISKVIRVLGRDVEMIQTHEWSRLESQHNPIQVLHDLEDGIDEVTIDRSTVVASGRYPQSREMSTMWKQHLAPQDGSLASCKIRRRGGLSFLRELLNMVRMSLQQADRDEFFARLGQLNVPTHDEAENEVGAEFARNQPSTLSVNQPAVRGDADSSRSTTLLSIIGNVLADPQVDVSEKGIALEIVSCMAMHDPGLVRSICLESCLQSKRQGGHPVADFAIPGIGRPRPNDRKQLLFPCPRYDLLGSLLYLLATEHDAGILLQVSEIMRIILDTDMVGDHGAVGAGFADEAEGIPPGAHPPTHDAHNLPSTSSATGTASSDQNKFLSMFYDDYLHWMTAPFQFQIFTTLSCVPMSVLTMQRPSSIHQRTLGAFSAGRVEEESFVKHVSTSATRASFAVELLSFCVRAHVYRMKMYLLRSQVLSNVLCYLRPGGLNKVVTAGDRCLKLAAIHLLRAILAVKDDLYHRHIIQNNLFGPVFETLRSNPVGDNLVSSAIVEMCDFIHNENTRSLIEHIVTKHLSADPEPHALPSLEDVSSPYVTTLTVLRTAYERNLNEGMGEQGNASADHSRYFHHGRSESALLNERAQEDQRKFLEADFNESYFESDDDGANTPPAKLDGQQPLKAVTDDPHLSSGMEAPASLHRSG